MIEYFYKSSWGGVYFPSHNITACCLNEISTAETCCELDPNLQVINFSSD